MEQIWCRFIIQQKESLAQNINIMTNRIFSSSNFNFLHFTSFSISDMQSLSSYIACFPENASLWIISKHENWFQWKEYAKYKAFLVQMDNFKEIQLPFFSENVRYLLFVCY